MKKSISSSVLLLATAFFVSTVAQAQRASSEPSFKNASVTSSSASESSPAYEIAINQKAMKSFNRNYPTSASVKWASSNVGSQATFSENSKLNRVFYRPNGRWLRTMTSYDQSLLDDDIKALVKDNFRKYEITNVTEIHETNLDCYFVNIESAKDFKVIIVYEGEAFVHKEYKK